MDLTRKEGCYSKELREYTPSILLCMKEKSVSLNDMITLVNGIIEPARIEAEAKRRFRTNLRNCKTKEEVNMLCHDTVIHGMYYTPKRRG